MSTATFEYLSTASTQLVTAEVEHLLGGILADDPTGMTPYLALQATEFPGPQDNFALAPWLPATWLVVPDRNSVRYFAQTLVGSKNGGTDFAAGWWHVFVGLDGPIEEPVQHAGLLRVR